MAIITPQNFRDYRMIFHPHDGGKDDKSAYAASTTLVGTDVSVATNALVLNGTDDHATLSDAAHNSLYSANQLTLFAWFNVDALGVINQTIISKFKVEDDNKAFFVTVKGVDDTIRFDISSAGTDQNLNLTTTDTITVGSVFFVCATWDGSRAKIFINGTESVSAFYSDGIFDSDATIALGALFAPADAAAQFFGGTIYQAGILGRALSEEEIETRFRLGKDYKSYIETKQLLLYEDFSGGKVPTDWLVKSGQFAVAYDSSLGEHYLECVSDGVIGIPIPQVMQDMALTGLEWEWDMLKATGGGLFFWLSQKELVSLGSANGYHVRTSGADAIILGRTTNGATSDILVSANSFITIGEYNTFRFTLSSVGEFTGHMNDIQISVAGGSGSNPVTNTVHTTTNYVVLEGDSGDRFKKITLRRF